MDCSPERSRSHRASPRQSFRESGDGCGRQSSHPRAARQARRRPAQLVPYRGRRYPGVAFRPRICGQGSGESHTVFKNVFAALHARGRAASLPALAVATRTLSGRQPARPGPAATHAPNPCAGLRSLRSTASLGTSRARARPWSWPCRARRPRSPAAPARPTPGTERSPTPICSPPLQRGAWPCLRFRLSQVRAQQQQPTPAGRVACGRAQLSHPPAESSDGAAGSEVRRCRRLRHNAPCLQTARGQPPRFTTAWCASSSATARCRTSVLSTAFSLESTSRAEASSCSRP